MYSDMSPARDRSPRSFRSPELQPRLLARLAPRGLLRRLGPVAAPAPARGIRAADRGGQSPARNCSIISTLSSLGSNGSTVTASPLVKHRRRSASDMVPSKRRWRACAPRPEEVGVGEVTADRRDIGGRRGRRASRPALGAVRARTRPAPGSPMPCRSSGISAGARRP